MLISANCKTMTKSKVRLASGHIQEALLVYPAPNLPHEDNSEVRLAACGMTDIYSPLGIHCLKNVDKIRRNAELSANCYVLPPTIPNIKRCTHIATTSTTMSCERKVYFIDTCTKKTKYCVSNFYSKITCNLTTVFFQQSSFQWLYFWPSLYLATMHASFTCV